MEKGQKRCNFVDVDCQIRCIVHGNKTQAALLRNTLVGPAKGGIYENFVFDMLTKRGFSLNHLGESGTKITLPLYMAIFI